MESSEALSLFTLNGPNNEQEFAVNIFYDGFEWSIVLKMFNGKVFLPLCGDVYLLVQIGFLNYTYF